MNLTATQLVHEIEAGIEFLKIDERPDNWSSYLGDDIRDDVEYPYILEIESYKVQVNGGYGLHIGCTRGGGWSYSPRSKDVFSFCEDQEIECQEIEI